MSLPLLGIANATPTPALSLPSCLLGQVLGLQAAVRAGKILFMLVHAALCLLSMLIAPGCISLSAWVTCVLHSHLLGLLVLEAHLPQDPQPRCFLGRVVGSTALERETA